MWQRFGTAWGFVFLAALVSPAAMDDGTALANRLKKHYLGKAYEGTFDILFNTENNGIPVKVTTQNKVSFKDPMHLAMTATLDFEIPALPNQPTTDIVQVHDGRKMWLDVDIRGLKSRQVLTISLANIVKVRNSQGQLSFMPGKPGAVDPVSLIVQYLNVFPWRIEARDGDWVTLYSDIPSLMWNQFGVVDPEGSKIDFSAVRIEANQKTNQIRSVRIGKGEKAHMVLTVATLKMVDKKSFKAELFQYKTPSGANVNDLDQPLTRPQPKAPAQTPPPKK